MKEKSFTLYVFDWYFSFSFFSNWKTVDLNYY